MLGTFYINRAGLFIGWSFYRLVFLFLESKNGNRGNRKKKKVGDLLIALLEDKEI